MHMHALSHMQVLNKGERRSRSTRPRREKDIIGLSMIVHEIGSNRPRPYDNELGRGVLGDGRSVLIRQEKEALLPTLLCKLTIKLKS